jgi:hypothetical protein
MIKFRDGPSITNEEAAQLIEAEGRLGAEIFVTQNRLRCAVGVIEDWTYAPYFTNTRQMISRDPVIVVNDPFEGTPEERCAHMAAYFRNLPEDDD